jgi:hypothetical protein
MGKSKVQASKLRAENLGKGHAVKRVQGVHVRQCAGFLGVAPSQMENN